LIKIIIKEQNFKWHLEAFASELFIYIYIHTTLSHFEIFIAIFVPIWAFQGHII